MRLAAAIGHALRFDTWRSLARTESLDDGDAADLMVDLALVRGLQSDPMTPRRSCPRGGTTRFRTAKTIPTFLIE